MSEQELHPRRNAEGRRLKHSEVGLIPADWDVRPIAETCERIMVGIASSATHAYRASGIPLLRNQNIKAGFLDDRDVLHVNPDYEEAYRNKRLRTGDLITARTGYPGLTCVVPAAYDGAQSFTTLISRPKKDVLDSQFICHFVNSPTGQSFFERSQIGGAQKNVNAGTLRQMPVPVPGLPEQKAIATALSDVDALIGSLDRLIAKKRDLKQAAMRKLLTGATRLPKFQGTWPTRRFADIFTRINAKAYQLQTSDYQPTGFLPVVDQGQDFVVGFTDRIEKRFRCPEAGVIVFGDHTCIVKYIDFDFVVGADGTQILAAKPGQSARFQALHLQHRGIQPTGYNRHFKFVVERDFVAPPLPEQEAIAAVLSDMDAEILALEQRRDKTRLLKEGMMQELLTGRTRLV